MQARHVIIGAGPAGLTTAWQLEAHGQRTLILEEDPHYVGGIARTVEYRGNRFDLGGHRFFSKSQAINRLWQDMLPGGFEEVERLSRIYYGGHFFPYPLKIGPTLRGLGLWTSGCILASYLWSRLRPRKEEVSFEDWIVNRFGYRLFAMFFKTYTEKVWGIPCDRISKDFAAQRIRGLSLVEAVRNALFPPRSERVKSLISTFLYPKLGPGQLWEAVRDHLVTRGHLLEMGRRVVAVHHAEGTVRAVSTHDGCRHPGEHFYSTMTLRDLILSLDPPPPPEVLEAARSLTYRDFLIVALIVRRPDVFRDNWIYIHDSAVQVGRIQNYRNWSPAMVADPQTTCLGMEYFCNRIDPIWNTEDQELVRMASREIARIGLVPEDAVSDGCVVRVPNAYPVYDDDYERHRETIKSYLNRTFRNLYPAGRGGLHAYNNQDHSMMTATLSVRNMMEGTGFDVWAVNSDAEYAEEGEACAKLEERLVPRSVSSR
ncbi:MAG: NAD(P)/FAD-dependent oxidoreductase [Armatimonadetes bacterium]|nr:NAD(P)/FAD-dependent oxidoreductase [Armatimonadota bacterium]